MASKGLPVLRVASHRPSSTGDQGRFSVPGDADWQRVHNGRVECDCIFGRVSGRIQVRHREVVWCRVDGIARQRRTSRYYVRAILDELQIGLRSTCEDPSVGIIG